MKFSSKTKILYIGPIPPEISGKSAGGIATHAWELATQAVKRGYEVYILANTTSSFTRDDVKVICQPQRNKLLKAFYGIRFWLTVNKNRVDSLNFFNFKEKIGVLYGACVLQEVVSSVKPDLIHIHSLHNRQTLSLKLLQNSIPIVITDHGFWQGIHTKRDITKIKKTAGEADYIICVSNFSNRQLENYKIAPLIKKKVIHNFISVNKIPLLDREKVKEELGLTDKKVVFFSGVVEPVKRKGLDILLKTIANNQYLKENSKLVIITNIGTIEYAQKFIKQEKINALILDPQPWDTIIKFYNAADVLVMPSRSESFGLVYEESLLAGTPVVGFYPIINELECLSGIYIGEKFSASKEDERALAQKIAKVLNTDFDRQLLRKKVIENLSWDVKFGEFESVYKEVLAE